MKNHDTTQCERINAGERTSQLQKRVNVFTEVSHFIKVLALTAKEPILPVSWSSQKVFTGCFLPLQSAAPLTLPEIQQKLSST
jgi:hypothetical protein